eukprot:6492799-Amphidinium_carterae.4
MWQVRPDSWMQASALVGAHRQAQRYSPRTAGQSHPERIWAAIAAESVALGTSSRTPLQR